MSRLVTKLDLVTGRNHFTEEKIKIWEAVIEAYGGLKCVNHVHEKYKIIPPARGITRALRRRWDFSTGTEDDFRGTVKNLGAIWRNNFKSIISFFENGNIKIDEISNDSPNIFSQKNVKKFNTDSKSILETAQEVIDRFGSDKKSLNQLVSILQTLDPS